jgi:hypothetical protein
MKTVATIEGGIDNSSFLDDKVEIEKSSTENPTKYSIFWIVPNQNYTVKIDINQDFDDDCEIAIGPGRDYDTPGPGEVVDIGTYF